MSYHGNSSAETLVDFERGIITISAEDTKSVKQAAIEILLTQFDPGVIDASTASDFGLINTKTQAPFFHEQVVYQDGLPIASVWRANRYVDYLLDKQQQVFGIRKSRKRKASNTSTADYGNNRNRECI